MAIPDTYSQLYPGRFLKADLFLGNKVTVTIARVELEELEGDKGKEPQAIITFIGKDRQWVANKTNGHCIQRMFGKLIKNWIGKRITLYPTTTKFGPNVVDCIRVWGSPDIERDMPISVPQGRKKPIEMVMHKVKPGECGYRGDAAAKDETPAPPQPIVAAQEPQEDDLPDFDEPVRDYGFGAMVP